VVLSGAFCPVILHRMPSRIRSHIPGCSCNRRRSAGNEIKSTCRTSFWILCGDKIEFIHPGWSEREKEKERHAAVSIREYQSHTRVCKQKQTGLHTSQKVSPRANLVVTLSLLMNYSRARSHQAYKSRVSDSVLLISSQYSSKINNAAGAALTFCTTWNLITAIYVQRNLKRRDELCLHIESIKRMRV